MNRWENSLYYLRGFAPDLWPGVIMVQKNQISDAQIMTMRTNPVILMVGPPGYLVFPERAWFTKPASPVAYSGLGVTGNLQINWIDNNSGIIAVSPAGVLDLAGLGYSLSASSVFAAASALGLAGFGYTGKNDGVNSNFQRISLTFATANPVVSGGGVLNVGFTYRLYPLIPAFP